MILMHARKPASPNRKAMSTPTDDRREVNRREFLGCSARQAAGVAAGVMSLAAPVLAAGTAERLSVAVIGVRNRGKHLATLLTESPDVHLKAVSDVDTAILSGALNSLTPLCRTAPEAIHDYRRILDDRSIDAVIIATPDHWHATMARQALEAGKDVYLESPITANLEESADLIAAATRSQRIVQCGLQERSGAPYRDAMRFLHAGNLGTVKLARAWVVHRRKPIPRRKDEPAPETLDYAAWLGPATERPFNPNRSHFNWRWFWDYGGGELTHWGSHLLDVARWGLQVNWPDRVAATGGKYAFDDATETPDTLMVQYAYPKHTIQWEHRLWSGHAPEGRSSAVAFYGERGVLVIDRGGWKVYDGEAAGGSCTSAELDRDHLQNFLSCVRTRQQPKADLATALVSTGLCHLGNLAYRAGHEITFHPQSGVIERSAGPRAV
ncbi:gfo/Idh/MocA family oxidoreductase [bacterium]|nr:gfo/Idh/MocA family oxidoreductase [bacterium]